MKILYVASNWQHLIHFHIPYIESLRARGHTVHVAAGGERRDFPCADRVIALPFQKKLLSPANFRAARQLSQVMRRERYDLIAVHTSLAAFFTRLAARLARADCPVCNTVHGYLFDDESPLLKRTVLLWAEKLMAPVTDTVVVMAKQDEEIARRHRLYRRELRFIRGMGVDFSRFPPITPSARREARQALGLTQGEFWLVFAGEFSPRKNQPLLIEALALLPERVRLLLLGDGAELERCRTLARERGVADRVRFEGYRSDTSRYYAASDLCVSSSRSEGLPFNLMEAMGMGLPVVATAVKGHTDLVKPDRNGILVPFGDAAAFAAAVEELLESPEKRAEYGAHNIADREAYSLGSVLSENIAIYEALLERSAARQKGRRP